jgi:hypothetical protein
MNDLVNSPDHYASEVGNEIDCLTAMHAMAGDTEFAGHLRCQVFKYLWRYKKKGKAVQDLEKAMFYQNRLKNLTIQMIEEKAKSDQIERLNLMAKIHEGMDE